MLLVEELEPRLCPTPPKPPIVPPIGTYALIDSLPLADKQTQMSALSAKYDAEVLQLASLNSNFTVGTIGAVTAVFLPVGGYLAYKNVSSINALTYTMSQDAMGYWYLSQQVP